MGPELRERLGCAYRTHLAQEHNARGLAQDVQPDAMEQAPLDAQPSAARWRKSDWCVSEGGGFVHPFEPRKCQGNGEVHTYHGRVNEMLNASMSRDDALAALRAIRQDLLAGGLK